MDRAPEEHTVRGSRRQFRPRKGMDHLQEDVKMPLDRVLKTGLQARPVGEPKFNFGLGWISYFGHLNNDSTTTTSSHSWEAAQEESVAGDRLRDHPARGRHLCPRYGLGQ